MLLCNFCLLNISAPGSNNTNQSVMRTIPQGAESSPALMHERNHQALASSVLPNNLCYYTHDVITSMPVAMTIFQYLSTKQNCVVVTDMPGGLELIMSNKTGASCIFHNAPDLSAAVKNRYIQSFQDFINKHMLSPSEIMLLSNNEYVWCYFHPEFLIFIIPELAEFNRNQRFNKKNIYDEFSRAMANGAFYSRITLCTVNYKVYHANM